MDEAEFFKTTEGLCLEYSEDEVARIFTNLIADSMQSPDYVADGCIDVALFIKGCRRGDFLRCAFLSLFSFLFFLFSFFSFIIYPPLGDVYLC